MRHMIAMLAVAAAVAVFVIYIVLHDKNPNAHTAAQNITLADLPLLAISYHSADNIYLYNATSGQPWGMGASNKHPFFLIPTDAASAASLSKIRGILPDPLRGGLYFANGKTSVSNIYYLPTVCGTEDNRTTLRSVTSSSLAHPYDIVFLPGSNHDVILISNQNGNGDIVSFNLSDANPSRVVVSMGAANSPRGIAVDPIGRLWVCADLSNSIKLFNVTNGAAITSWAVIAPIAVRYDTDRNWMIVTNNDKRNSRVIIYDVATLYVLHDLSHPLLEHGSGLASSHKPGEWFVLSRNTNTLFLLNLRDVPMLMVLNDQLLHEPEQLHVLSRC